MKPSEDPRSPFSLSYKAKIDWSPHQVAFKNQANTTANLEKKRLQDKNYDKKVGMMFNKDRGAKTTLPKQFNVYSRKSK